MGLINHIVDVVQGKAPVAIPRSPRWQAARSTHLMAHPVCEVCGGTVKLEVHHIQPFHIHPELELNPTNLVTLCEANKGGMNCHLAVGHLGNFKSFNPNVVTDASEWAVKIKTRPFYEA